MIVSEYTLIEYIYIWCINYYINLPVMWITVIALNTKPINIISFLIF